jgi:hypothetical protein
MMLSSDSLETGTGGSNSLCSTKRSSKLDRIRRNELPAVPSETQGLLLFTPRAVSPSRQSIIPRDGRDCGSEGHGPAQPLGRVRSSPSRTTLARRLPQPRSRCIGIAIWPAVFAIKRSAIRQRRSKNKCARGEL